MEILLTKDSEKALCEIYAVYLERRAAGVSKSAAKDFSKESDWPEKYRKEWADEDFKDCLVELKRAGMVKLYLYGDFELQDAAIIYMERRFQRGISEVLDWLAKVKSAVPFL